MAISSIILTHKVCFFVCILNYRTLDVIHNNWIASVAPADVKKRLKWSKNVCFNNGHELIENRVFTSSFLAAKQSY